MKSRNEKILNLKNVAPAVQSTALKASRLNLDNHSKLPVTARFWLCRHNWLKNSLQPRRLLLCPCRLLTASSVNTSPGISDIRLDQLVLDKTMKFCRFYEFH